MENVEKLINDLTKKILSHNEAYYINNKPLISDFEYDMLYRKLSDLLEQNPQFLTEDSPVNLVGKDHQTGFNRGAHPTQMYSLQNTYTTDELDQFIRNSKSSDYCIELKIDGLALNLLYDKGKLVAAITRGDGTLGDNVTKNVLQIKDIPQTITNKSKIEIRGEVYVKRSIFTKLNKELLVKGKALYANPRNLASGSLKLHSVSEVKKRELSFKAYEVVGIYFEKQHHKLNFLEEQGFDIPDFKVCSPNDISKVLEKISTKKPTLEFDIDGAVIKVDTCLKQEKLGFNTKHPKWATAFKFETEKVCTTLLDIEFSVGRSGAVTPVALLKPVLISGTVVKRATLHNESFILELGLSKGCQVFLEKGGEIIPKITGLYGLPSKTNLIKYPADCPCCGTKLQNPPGEAKWYCPNKLSCKDQLIESISLFVSKKAMDIDGFGEELSKLLINTNLVKNVADIYLLDKDKLASLPGFKNKSINNLLKSIENSKNVKLENFIFALGIPGIGSITAKIIVKHFKTLYKLSKASTSELEQINGIGYILASSIYDWFRNEQNRVLIKLFRRIIKHKKYVSNTNLQNTLAGKKICITGAFEGYNRDDIVKMIEDAGGTACSKVTKDTDILLCGDGKFGNKLKDAEKYKTQIIDNLNIF